ncbi:MAG: alpha/beta hydrolase [Hyphomicrobium sp.]
MIAALGVVAVAALGFFFVAGLEHEAPMTQSAPPLETQPAPPPPEPETGMAPRDAAPPEPTPPPPEATDRGDDGIMEGEEEAKEAPGMAPRAGSPGPGVPEHAPLPQLAPDVTTEPAPAPTPWPEPTPAPTPVPTTPLQQPAAVPKEEKVQGEWDVVPVFYGTDRLQQPNPARIDYGSDRGRRLELGRALVTVPKNHQVPAIERPWAFRVLGVTLYEEAEDPNRHFTIDEISTMSEEQFLEHVRERLAASARYKDHAFIFVHGYNTSFDHALYRTAQISYDLKFDGAAFAYSWPSGGGLASYTYDRESSGQSEPYLKQFMELVIAKTGAKSVSIIAHSMGNQPTLQVLKDLRYAKPEGVRIGEIVLAAPDVDRDNFENIARDIQGLATGVTLYAAGNDRALTVSRNFYGGVPRAGDVPSTGPIVLPGIDTIDVSAASLDSLGLNHSSYAENNAVLRDIGALIQNGTRPPKLRTPALEEVDTPKGIYWRYPATQP